MTPTAKSQTMLARDSQARGPHQGRSASATSSRMSSVRPSGLRAKRSSSR